MDHQTFAQLLGNYGEFLGAIAVVGTLVYLALQVRQSKDALDHNTRALEENRKLTLADSVRQQTRVFDELNFRITRDRETAETFLRGNQNLGQLDEVDQLIYGCQISALLNNHFAVHRMCEEGFLDHQMADRYDRYLGDMLRQHPGMRTLWEKIGPNFVLQDHINTLMDQDSEGRIAFGEPILSAQQGT